MCSIDAEPFLLLPGANIFIAQEDLSQPSSAEGRTAVHCQRIDEGHAALTANKGWNYLRRILAGIPVA